MPETLICDFTTKYAMPALVDCGLAVSWVVVEPAVRERLTENVPLVTVLLFTSLAVTAAVDVEAPSDTIGVGLKVQARWSTPPEVQTTRVFTPLMPVAENVMLQPGYAPALLIAKVAMPPEVVVDAETLGAPPPAPLQLLESNVAVMVRPVSLVTSEPFASRTPMTMCVQLGLVSPVPAVVQVPEFAAACGESLLLTVSLFAAPVICVCSDAELPATPALLVVAVNEHDPGVVVDWTLNSTRPWAAVAVPLLVPNEPALPVMTPITLQMLAPESFWTVTTVELSAVLRLPFTSMTSTRRVEVDVPSEAIGLWVNDVRVAAEDPGPPERVVASSRLRAKTRTPAAN